MEELEGFWKMESRVGFFWSLSDEETFLPEVVIRLGGDRMADTRMRVAQRSGTNFYLEWIRWIGHVFLMCMLPIR